VICTGIAFSSVLPTDVFGQSTTSPLMGNHPVYSSPTEVDESTFHSTIPIQLGPDISKYFSDAYVNIEDVASKRNFAAMVSSLTISTAGAMVLAWFAYDFFANQIKGGAICGAICAPIAILSPWLGFYAVSSNNIRNLMYIERWNSQYAYKIHMPNLIEDFLVSIPSILTTLPLVFVTYTSMCDVMGPLVYIFSVGTFLVFFQYYNKTSKSVIDKTKKFLPSCCRKQNVECAVTKRLAHVERFLDKARKNYLPPNRNGNFDHVFDENLSNKVDELYRDVMGGRGQELIGLLSSPSINDYLADIDNEGKMLSFKTFFSLLGGACGIAGAYYFFAIGKDEVHKDLKNFSPQLRESLTEIVGVLTYLCRGTFSMVTGYFCFDSLYEKTKNGKIISKESALLIVLSCFGAVSSTQMSLEYLGYNVIGYIFTAFTTIALITGVYWGQELFFEKLGYDENESFLTKKLYDLLKLTYTDVRKTPPQKKIKKLENIINDMYHLLPYLKNKDHLQTSVN
ncbi:MAG: hypothetical protein Q8R43_02475, partial [Alphaproteobacteria bacterium]|nr:hypothetical protein [Alphaproteobacteria bacterium]